MIIKNILKKIKFHPIFFFLAFISVLTGLFKEFLVFFSIIFIHEIGHIIAALIFNWKIESINFYPYGGLIKFNEHINKPIKEEFIIVISGLIIQIIYYCLICILHNLYYITDYLFLMFKNYHYSILLFNLIPIFPLDGMKILNLGLCKIFPFKLSHYLSILLSYFFVIIFILFCLNHQLSMNTILIISLLINKINYEMKNHNYYYNKFIFERYLYNFKFPKIKILKNNKINKMYRDKKHVFKIKNEYITENKILKQKFNKQLVKK